MSTLKVNTVLSADTPTVNFTDGLNVSGIVTATSFRGGGSSGITIDSSGNVTKPTCFGILVNDKWKPNGI